MTPTERRAAVREWARARLRAISERGRGHAAQMAKKIGISTAHMTNITRDPPRSGIGDEVLDKLVAAWGYPSYAEMEAEALSGARSVEAPARYENLDAVIATMRGDFPDEFLERFRREAANYSPNDLPHVTWKFAIRGAWDAERGKAIERPDSGGDELGEGRAGPPKRSATKRRAR